MDPISLNKGYALKIKGKPATDVVTLDRPDRVGLMPVKIPFIKPRLLVEEGDAVKIGTPVFEDKRNTNIRFPSPGSGTIETIQFGPRRVIEQIVIRLQAKEAFETFDVSSGDGLDAADRETVVDQMIKGGVWPFIRSLPFRDIADTRTIPPLVFIGLGSHEPFHPDPLVYLKGRESDFLKGVEIVKKIAADLVFTSVSDLSSLALNSHGPISTIINHVYPAGNPAVELYHKKQSEDENRSWFVDGQDLVQIGRFFETGRFPTERVMVVAGSLAKAAHHVKTRAGVPIAHLAKGSVAAGDAVRHIVGGVFTGFTGSADGFMGIYENALNLLPEGNAQEAFGFARPGFNKPSYSRAFLSVFNKQEMDMDCGSHGEERACINCGTCSTVCPVDILPQFTLKCVLADEVEEALLHGLLDCAQCGLCTYVCPSKIELCKALTDAKARYYKEIS